MELEQALEKVRAARIFALSEATRIADIARERLDLKRNFNESVQKIETDYRATRAVDLESIQALIAKAVTDWPGKHGSRQGGSEGRRRGLLFLGIRQRG